jgi:hypothetical protein
MDVPVQGLVRIDLEVRRRVPLAGEQPGDAGADVASKTNKGGV